MDKKTEKTAPPRPRRDATGHLDPQYAADLRALSKEGATPPGDDKAFFPGPRSDDDLAEHLGEGVVEAVTSGGAKGEEEVFEEVVVEEIGGPFVESTAAREFAHDTDASNPPDATREPFPAT